jgi:sugar lactone lactonase YvrE
MRCTDTTGAAASKPEHVVLGAVVLVALLGACGDRDITLATGLSSGGGSGEAPAPGGDPSPSIDAGSLGPAPLPPVRDAGPEPAGAGTSKPVVPIEPPPKRSEPPVVARDCSLIPEVPIDFEALEGFASSEDFVFDALGNYVGVDADGNLVRIAKTGETQLWAPALAVDTAGMAILPDGSVVFCDVQEGAVKRVYPNGSVVVVLGGLLYPNGIDIGPDGFIYVAEHNAGRVRRVHPETGEFSIVALGLDSPNGVAFSDDPHVLYVGSFVGSGVYKVVLDDPEQVGQVSVFARPGESTLREPVFVCSDNQEGAECKTDAVEQGHCQVLANVVDCFPEDPCPNLEEGASCTYPAFGACSAGRCVTPDESCEGRQEGDPCEDHFVGVGVCYGYGSPQLFCSTPNPCDDLEPGDACEESLFAGTCEGSDGYYFCTPPDPCAARAAGETCDHPFFGPGRCEDDGAGNLWCELLDPCDGRNAGDACEDPYNGPGHCGVAPVPAEPALDGLTPLPDEAGGAATESSTKLDAGALGDAAAGPLELVCLPPNPCLAQPDGTECYDPFQAGSGLCRGELCVVRPFPGGIDGLGVDACGNVYASEFTYGNIWRISPAGNLELLAQLPSTWIPNIKWGRGLGGFAREIMYVADRYSGRLFGLPVGVPGATEYFDTVDAD